MAKVKPSEDGWSEFAKFRVLDDHTPMSGMRMVIRVVATPTDVDRLLAARAQNTDVLDPELAQYMVRAGVGLAQSDNVDFVFATPEESVVLLAEDAIESPGQSKALHDGLLSGFASRCSLFAGSEVTAHATVYEFPDLDLATKAFAIAQQGLASSAIRRSFARLGAQLKGKGEKLKGTTSEDKQKGALADQGIEFENLPAWYFRGVAARSTNGKVELFDNLPSGDEFASFVFGE